MEHVTKNTTNTVQQSHTIEMRDRIVCAAEKLFYEHGYVRVTIRDIASMVGTPSVNVYRFFDSKTALLEALVQRITQQVEESCTRIAHGKGDAAEQLSQVILEYQRVSMERFDPALGASDLFREAIMGNHLWSTMHSTCMRKLFWELILDGVHNNEFKVTDVDSAARMVCYAITAFVDPMQISVKVEHDTDLKEAREMCHFIIGSLKSGCL